MSGEKFLRMLAKHKIRSETNQSSCLLPDLRMEVDVHDQGRMGPVLELMSLPAVRRARGKAGPSEEMR